MIIYPKRVWQIDLKPSMLRMLSKEELARMAKWKKISQELLEKGASAKDLMGVYEEIFDSEKEASIQSAKDLIKGIFDDDDDQPEGAVAAAAAASLFKTKDDDYDPFSPDGGGGGGGAPPSAPAITIFRDDKGGPDLGGAGALAEPIRVLVSENSAQTKQKKKQRVIDGPSFDR